MISESDIMVALAIVAGYFGLLIVLLVAGLWAVFFGKLWVRTAGAVVLFGMMASFLSPRPSMRPATGNYG
ncbi:hypothetical protein [Jannaschia rubra]|uniref:Uncharacterized protein n=1 Tax=Jannaschia rubra TaxID=282197 RepID=A0A0M6XKZ7_9RHOB|nr:hypothetical protein [Jannaschia rubra]CTQ31860.1 hypothetical protein JAN5088_00619 [Jannaschia rubra]SFG52053.1 hypothetical protein SAMN04488517_1064 [Jannaschia rubra]